MIKRIIFDIDNTLLASSKDTKEAYKEYLTHKKLNIAPEELYKILDDFIDNDINHNYETLLDHIKKYIDETFTSEDIKIFLSYYESKSTLLEENIPSTLEYLKEKYELVALTNWFEKEQTTRMDNANLSKYFASINGFDKIGAKPLESTFEKICSPYNYEECVIIGDSMNSDIVVPHKLGMRAILLSKEYNENIYESIKKIEDLKNVL